MNERIKELKQQAGIDFNPDQEGLDLFAELIVLDCTTIVQNQGAFLRFDNLAKKIKQHFGVEE
jgi:hypothetical protein